jgi:hypothetical protein
MNRRNFVFSAAIATAALTLPLPAEAGGPNRTVEVFRDGRFQPLEGSWASLKSGMVFRLRDPDMSIVDEGTKHEVSVALDDAKSEPAPAYWGVRCEPLTQFGMDHPFASVILLSRQGEALGSVESVDMVSNLAWQRQSNGEVRTLRFDNIKVDLGSYKGEGC